MNDYGNNYVDPVFRKFEVMDDKFYKAFNSPDNNSREIIKDTYYNSKLNYYRENEDLDYYENYLHLKKNLPRAYAIIYNSDNVIIVHGKPLKPGAKYFFPGGAMTSGDTNLFETALRECSEEIVLKDGGSVLEMLRRLKYKETVFSQDEKCIRVYFTFKYENLGNIKKIPFATRLAILKWCLLKNQS